MNHLGRVVVAHAYIANVHAVNMKASMNHVL
jgi:hypothetical protein